MSRLFPDKIKVAGIGEKFQNKDHLTPSEEGVELNTEKNLFEQIPAHEKEPGERFQLGNNIELTTVMVSSDSELLNQRLNIDSLMTDEFELPDRKVQFRVQRTDKPAEEVFKIANIVMEGDLTEDVNPEDGYYLPLDFKSDKTTRLIIGFYKNSAFTAELDKIYAVDTIDSAVTTSLPASPSSEDIVVYFDYNDNFGINNLTIDGNGNDINSSGTTSYAISSDGVRAECEFDGTLWQINEITTI